MIERWVAFWDHHEHPRSLALVRFLVGAVLLSDLLSIWRLGLIVPLLAPVDAGGLADLAARGEVPAVYRWLPWTVGTGVALYATVVLAAVSFSLGWFTRTSALVLVVAYAQMGFVMPMSDRGIDVLIRNLLVVFAFSGAGAWGSLDARYTTGSWWGDGGVIPAWPRYLIVLQVVVMYFTAGVMKIGVLWLPVGHFAALYVVLQDWAIARHPFGWMGRQPWYFASQVATAVTVMWEWSAPLVLVWFRLRATASRGGRLRRWALRVPFHLVFLGVGVVFHLSLHLTTELGIFPWAMLATYPAFLHPDEWRTLMRRAPAAAR